MLLEKLDTDTEREEKAKLTSTTLFGGRIRTKSHQNVKMKRKSTKPGRVANHELQEEIGSPFVEALQGQTGAVEP